MGKKKQAVNKYYKKFPTKTNKKNPFLDDPIMKKVKQRKAPTKEAATRKERTES